MITDKITDFLKKISNRIKSLSPVFFTILMSGVLACLYLVLRSAGNSGFWDTVGGLWVAIFKATLTLLLSVLIFIPLALLWTLGVDTIKKRTSRYERAFYIALTLAVLTSAMLSLIKGTSGLAAADRRDLTISIFFTASAWVTLKILIQRDRNKAHELEQLALLVKWLQEDETGWHELCTGRLQPAVRSVIEQKLLSLQEMRSIAGSSEEDEHEKRLRHILLSSSEPSK